MREIMNNGDHEKFEEFADLFALGALEGSEQQEFLIHLKLCEKCQQSLDETREVIAHLTDLFDDVPPGLWEAIDSKLGKTTKTKANRSYKISYWPRLIAAAILIVVSTVIGVLGYKVSELESQVGQLSNASFSQQITMVAQKALTNPENKKYILFSGNQKPVAELVVTNSQQAYLWNLSLKPVSDSQTYQLWGINNSEAISLGVLGNSFKLVTFKFGSFSQFHEVAMTIEKAGGVVISKQKPVCIAKI